MPGSRVRDRLKALGLEREGLQRELTGATNALEAGAAVLRDALALVEDMGELYRQSGDQGRRALNQTFFEKLYLDSIKLSTTA